MKKTILFLSILVISSSYLFSFDHGVSASVGISESINAVYAAPFSTKTQWETRINLKFHFPIGGTFFIDTGGTAHFICPSGYSAAYYYRGHKGGGFDIGFGLRFDTSGTGSSPVSVGGVNNSGPNAGPPRISTAAGVVIGGSFSFSVYDHSYQLFFYPSVYLAPFFDLRFSPASFFFLRFTAPLRLSFRRDLDHSSSYGLGISAVFDFEKIGGKRHQE